MEAARDKQWGCGWHKKDRRCYDPKQWTGINRMGDLLTCIREKMMKETDENRFSEEARNAHRTLAEIQAASSRALPFHPRSGSMAKRRHTSDTENERIENG